MAEIFEEEEFDKNRVHTVYGLSKDLSSGRLLISMLSDTKFIKEYIETNKQRIQKMYHSFVDGFKQLEIGCIESSAGLYCWANMSGLIPFYIENGEHELWYKLLNIAKVNVTPGSACHCIELGWFRCCFTALAPEDIPTVMELIRKVAETRKSSG
ncbi:hypothetical protein H0E87_021904 [Populus deltoides]|uniref:Aminotransferase class I/classII large domain-containing protein n=1 Tax=Populus deltoides TaxID=3696 RepID=A0A8T2XIA5_POPDE|nr:hypothetical protein H0E87_021904 [Populus deltoides]